MLLYYIVSFKHFSFLVAKPKTVASTRLLTSGTVKIYHIYLIRVHRGIRQNKINGFELSKSQIRAVGIIAQVYGIGWYQ